MNFKPDRDYASILDSQDPLKSYRDKFYIPQKPNGEEVIYFAGNSLGLQPKSVGANVEQELKDWGTMGVEGHMHAKNPWLPYHEFLTKETAKLVGAKLEEVVNMNSLTVNLHLMMVSFYRPTPQRHKILIEANAFPSDHYAVQSQIKFHGYNPAEALIEMKPREGEAIIRTEDIESLIKKEGDSIALIMFAGVNYYTGQAFDFESITKAGHEKWCVVGFDLAHAAGNLILNLHDWDVDFAVWCNYKYLNGGPGAIGGAFVHKKHLLDMNIPKFWGWWGQDKATRFLMRHNFQPIPTVESWQLSNPPILQLAALKASLDIFDEAGMDALRGKSEKLTGYMEYLIDEKNDGNIEIITPKGVKQRGCQLSLRAKTNGKSIHKKLNRAGVVCDWREPDVIRVAPVPMYNTFTDVWKFVENLFK
ncbi:MAG: kynureninase [Chlorobi bacterium]|nr:kynureninase [Chlorobiota bacterium]MCI0714834.1 kynureninase [Chlorobiota bacterium]